MDMFSGGSTASTKATGGVMVGLGFLFMLMSMLLLFDRGLLVIANILILTGLSLLMGVQWVLKFFNPFVGARTLGKVVGILMFFAGFLMLLLKRGWVFLDFVLQLIGLFQMFGSFLPQVLGVLRVVPGLGTVLCLPGIREALDFVVALAPPPSKARSAKGMI